MEIQIAQTTRPHPKIQLFSGPGTRKWPRYNLEDVPSIKGIRSNYGSRIKVANISRDGALLQTWRQQEPGTRIRLKVETTEGIISLQGVVLRSSYFPQNGVYHYQVAVVFKHLLPIPDLSVALHSGTAQAGAFPLNMPVPIPQEDSGSSSKYAGDEFPSMIDILLSIRFANNPEDGLDEMLKLNNW